jgi:AraC-like DNA-binding protein
MTTGDNLSMEIRFRYEGGSQGKRSRPCEIAWRQLPYALIETPAGGNWILEVEGTAPATVHSGEAMLIPRGVRHRFHMDGPPVMTTTWAFVCFDDPAGRDVLARARIPFILPRPTVTRLVKLMDLFRALDDPIVRGDLGAIARRHRSGFELLEVLLRHAERPQASPVDPELERLLPTLRYVEANLEKPLAVPDLARRASLSPSRFHFVFKRALGMAPLAYVQQARLRFAQHLLLTSEARVADVAAKAGYDSSYYFCRVFRRFLHTTPTKFRQEFSRYHLERKTTASRR